MKYQKLMIQHHYQSQRSVNVYMSVWDRFDMYKADIKAMSLSTDLLQLSQYT